MQQYNRWFNQRYNRCHLTYLDLIKNYPYQQQDLWLIIKTVRAVVFKFPNSFEPQQKRQKL